MLDMNKLPSVIKDKIGELNYSVDELGCSGADIIFFDDMVLKVEKTSGQSNREYDILKWIDGRLSVPEVIEFVQENGYNYLLVSRLSGEMICSEENMRNLDFVAETLANGLKKLWSLDISHCPYSSRLDERLKDAKYNIDNGLVDVDDAEEDTFGENGFEDVDALYTFLVSNKPDEDLVFTHGDYCLPNIFVDDNDISFLDLGKAGIADRWQDVALCIRSLKYNVCDLYGASEEEFERLKEKIYSILGIKEDKEKLRYYILLDELF